jgi:peptide/nickel transport system substrate-binding protein
MSKDYVRIGYYTAQPNGIDPFHAFDPDSFVAVSACHNSLMDIGGSGELKGSLAAAWKRISPTCMAVSLRKDISFHNGEPFDARAVVTTLNTHCNPDSHSPLGWFVFKPIRYA